MTAHARWLRMDAALKIVAAEGCSLEEAVRLALTQIEGTFGIAVVSSHRPNTLIGARRGSPLVLGVGEEECLLTSDAATVLDYTDQCVYLDDGDLVRIEQIGRAHV